MRPDRWMFEMGRRLLMLVVCDDAGTSEYFPSLAGDLPLLATSMG